MPPAKRRARTYNSARIREAVTRQFAHVHEAVRGLGAEQLAAPAGLGEWTVRDLAAHLTMAVGSVSRALDAPEPTGRPMELLGYPQRTAEFGEAIAEGSHALAERSTDLVALYDEVAELFAERIAGAPDGRLLAVRSGAITLADYLVTRTVELVVHTDDLNRATGLDIPLERQAVAACTRLLADTLADRAPGASTEVRIPPYAVVQCIEGPRHTRGTPPNVVETDPLTWIRLATGRMDWQSALDAASVAASGERADLSALLPVMR
ncbi:maleylpyruvate isomerase family mycothiol-dependent enzyme [Streptomyces triticagri]|uniref:Maleylpyruvate isomerase family mycothiol-dependent enzyme n=1 Tax=Streptomyces triticagri TaxID=2293568 RepID=A0A372LWE1_9ACTN|nr:maleylpyruvate isomerase family mycothiol-dependent enzyme [Streptomyces triticagri]RFU82859.1 maleylpyruvate isomerase family mycothiol-dependent enzyme [Streptomyces triticagri]